MSYLIDSIPVGISPIKSIAAVAPLDRAVELMRRELERDRTPTVVNLVKDPKSASILSGYWYQRVDLGPLGFTSKSDHARIAPAGDNPLHDLFGRLTPHEAQLLQPYTKWDYIQEILPDVKGKSVLEAGSANGFFSLEFAKRGARVVNGIEAWDAQIRQAKAVAELRGVRNVQYHQGDVFYDSIEPHDVVFVSEVLNHCVTTTHCIFRLLGLAKETLIIDEFAAADRDGSDLISLVGNGDGRVQFTGTSLSENLVLTLCYLAGVDLSKVVRWRDDRDPGYETQPHTLFVIDTRGAKERRAERLASPYLQASVESAMGIRPSRRIESARP